MPDLVWGTRSHRRRVVNGRVEIWINCPQLCHGFGVCRYCGDRGGYWRRPSPRYTPYAPGGSSSERYDP